MTDMLLPSAPRVSRDTALELMVHHLQLAHMYFQNIPKDQEVCRKEAERLFQQEYLVKCWVDDGGLGKSELQPYCEDAPEIVAGLLWLDKMEEIYTKMAEDD